MLPPDVTNTRSLTKTRQFPRLTISSLVSIEEAELLSVQFRVELPIELFRRLLGFLLG